MHPSVCSTLIRRICFWPQAFFTSFFSVFCSLSCNRVRVWPLQSLSYDYHDYISKGTCARVTLFPTMMERCKSIHIIRFLQRLLIKVNPLHRMSLIEFCSLKGVRIGEASNPGPGPSKESKAKKANLRLAICNPTALYGKVGECLQLNSDIVCVSETSSTIIAQKALNTEFANFGYRCFWSKEVESLKATNDHRPSFRGEASGTAIVTRILARQPRLKIPDILYNTCRFTCAIFQVCSMDILVISLYGFAKKIQEGRRMNDILFTLVHQVIAQVNIPFIIAGDFNEPVQKLPIYQEFKKIGVVEAFEFYEQHFGGQLPATCRGSTRHDTAIIHHSLVPMIQGMHVKEEHLFDSHTPLFIDFDLLVEKEHTFSWNIPQSWAPLNPKKEFIDENYMNSFHRFFAEIPSFETVEEGDKYLLKWSKAVEHAVSMSLKQQHLLDPVGSPHDGLSDVFRGRCQPRALKPIQTPKTVCDDKHGGFNPPCEILGTKAKLKTKQVRRILSLLRALKSSSVLQSESQNIQLQKAWDAIRKAQGFGHRWDHWILGFEPITFVPLNVPCFEDLELMMTITKMDCESSCWLEYYNRKKRYDHKIQIDAQDNFSRFSYSIVKGHSTQALHEVPIEHQCEAVLLRGSKGKSCIRLMEKKHFRINEEASFGNAKIVITSQTEQVIHFRVIEGAVPAKALLQQTKYAIRKDDIFQAFHDFWNPMWNRETFADQSNPDVWKDVIQDIDDTMIPSADIEINVQDISVWKRTIQKLGLNKAHGICGWRYEELKLLPDIAIKHLAQIFENIYKVGGSNYLMTARTYLLPKISKPESMNPVRPITILSCLYRLASKVLADQVGSALAGIIPLGVSGGLPGRGVKDMAIIQKLQIEESLVHNFSLCGFSLDLIKAFNTFPRLPLAHMMNRLGIPTWVTHFWLLSLSRLVRHPQYQGALGLPTGSTTGVPEGDGMSVISMVALGAYYYAKIQSQYTYPFSYADNWCFFTSEERELHRAFKLILNLTSSLKISIDFKKSWFWANCKNLRLSCKTTSVYFPRGDIDIPILYEAKDLGEQVHYRKSMSLGFVKDKFMEGENRIRRIASLPTSIDHKARLIQSAVWPFALYTADTNYVGAHHIAKLRRAALNALVGDWNNSCPWLLGIVLSKHISDPFMYILQNILRLLRRLAHIRLDLARKFIRMACEHTSIKAWGPASALCLYLGRLGWKLSIDGFLQISCTRQINLLTTSTKEIACFVSETWPDVVLAQVNRKGIGDFPLHSSITIKAFGQIPSCEQNFVALAMVGGFQTEGQKTKWAEDSDGCCPLCEAKDCHKHYLLECPVLEASRKGHEEAIEILENQRPEWVYFPIARRHPRISEMEVFNSSIPKPSPPENPVGNRSHRIFYTDGGCTYPTDRYARMSSWSIVEVFHDEVEQEQHLAEDQIPIFRSVGLGLVSGKQTASRGELMALDLTIQSIIFDEVCESADIFVDAQYLLNLTCRMDTSKVDDWSFRAPNSDLITSIFQNWKKKKINLHKVKSHRSTCEAETQNELWQIAGNNMADMGATASLARIPTCIKELAESIDKFHKKELDMLQKVLKYMVAVNACRVQKLSESRIAKKAKEDAEAENLIGRLMPPKLNGDDAIDFLCDFHVSEYSCLPHQIIDEQCFHACFQGANIAKALSIWCSTLKWPVNICDQADYRRKDDWGISWLELFFNFCLCTRRFFPIRIEGRKKDSVYIDFHSDEALLNFGKKRAANMQTLCMERLIRALEKLQQCTLFPTFKSNQCKSLMRFGYAGKHTGIPCRPVMNKQTETMEWVRKFMVKARSEGHLGQTPVLPNGQAIIDFPSLIEKKPNERWAIYFQIKGKQRRDRLANAG